LSPWRGSSSVVASDGEVAALSRASADIRAIHDVGAVGGFGTIEDAKSPGTRAIIVGTYADKALDSPIGVGGCGGNGSGSGSGTGGRSRG
jgi:hypothetical protein